MAEHGHKRSSWIAVMVLIASSILLGFALPLESVALAVAGVVVGLVGLVIAWRGKIMEDVS